MGGFENERVWEFLGDKREFFVLMVGDLVFRINGTRLLLAVGTLCFISVVYGVIFICGYFDVPNVWFSAPEHGAVKNEICYVKNVARVPQYYNNNVLVGYFMNINVDECSKNICKNSSIILTDRYLTLNEINMRINNYKHGSKINCHFDLRKQLLFPGKYEISISLINKFLLYLIASSLVFHLILIGIFILVSEKNILFFIITGLHINLYTIVAIFICCFCTQLVANITYYQYRNGDYHANSYSYSYKALNGKCNIKNIEIYENNYKFQFAINASFCDIYGNCNNVTLTSSKTYSYTAAFNRLYKLYGKIDTIVTPSGVHYNNYKFIDCCSVNHNNVLKYHAGIYSAKYSDQGFGIVMSVLFIIPATILLLIILFTIALITSSFFFNTLLIDIDPEPTPETPADKYHNLPTV